ncbi:rRNA pseudouridine synthase [Candidatus Saccharibacteria bacterium]|nr:rRNA pseudouridine synthase [Candidatus Saccharibacteria bacterium]
MPNRNQPQSNPLNPQIRLNKFLAERLGISRREADGLIESGSVLVSGKTASIGERVDKTQEVCYNGKSIPFSLDFTYLALNKPIGYVCSKKRQDDTPTVYELLPKEFKSLKTVGRLDKDSSGLILFTNDGDFAFQMTHPSFSKTKIYHVTLDRNLEPLHQQMIADYGIRLSDGVSKLGLVKLNSDESRKRNKFEVTMSEGRNRQIRRTFEALGYHVAKLHRIGFGKYNLGTLAPGEYCLIEKL